MTDYSDLVKALRCCDEYALCNDCPMFETCDGDVDKAMAIAADAIEALQAQLPKRGEWIERTDVAPFKPDGEITSWTYRCSKCGNLERLKQNYCPNCGAKMEVQDESAGSL